MEIDIVNERTMIQNIVKKKKNFNVKSNFIKNEFLPDIKRHLKM